MAMTFVGMSGVSGGGSWEGIFESTRTFRVQSDNITTDDEFVVANFIPIGYGQSHPTCPFAYALDKRATLVDTIIQGDGVEKGALWDVEIRYGALTPLQREMIGDGYSPLSLVPVWHFQAENSEDVVRLDKDGKPVANSAGDPFDPPLMRPLYRGVYSARVNMALEDVTLPGLAALSNKVNVDAIGPFAEKTLLSLAFTMPEPVFFQEGDFWFLPMVFDFAFNPDTWKAKVPDRGYRELNALGDAGSQKRILDYTGQDIQEPAFLNGSGRKKTPPVTSAEILEFDIHDEISFADNFGDFLGTEWVNV